MQINKIIKLAIKRLEREGKVLTPDFYAEAFCKEAKAAGVKIDDCHHVEKLLSTLNPDLQKELKNYRILTLSELSRFLIAKLNRANKSKCTELLDAQNDMDKSVLKAITLLHNVEATELAKKTIELLNTNPTKTQIEFFKQMWDNFIANYDDTFLEKLKQFGDVDSKNLKKTIENLKQFSASGDNIDLEKVSASLLLSLSPSIASQSNEKIESISKKLRENPNILLENDIEKEIKLAISARIALDKKTVKDMVLSLEVLLDKLSKKLLKMIEKSDGSTIEIQKIKKELELYSQKENEINFQLAHKKLYTIATALEENAVEFKHDLENHNDNIAVLKEKVKTLEAELKKVKEEAKTDFLTKLYNKRALDEFLHVKEGEFERYQRNYCIAMFDIDYFKKVNDTYGHDAGDAILAAFAKILKKESREVDIVGRFGGEEFMVILGDTNIEGASKYAEKVRNHVQKAKFMYKGQRIPITVSGGLASRDNFASMKQTIKEADENLYRAKNDGRNRIVY